MDISPKLIDLRQKIESLSIDSNAKDSLISQLDSVSTLVEEKNRRMAIEESYVKLITDNINEVIFVIDLADLRFSYVSSSVYRLLGYFPEDLVGQSIMPFLTESSREYVKQITNCLLYTSYFFTIMLKTVSRSVCKYLFSAATIFPFE